MAIDMTNAKYLTRYFINGNQHCWNEHCFNFGKKKPIIPQVGERVILTAVNDGLDDEYSEMLERWYEVMGITYNMNDMGDDDVVMIDIEVFDVTDEVMEEAANKESNDDGCHCCGGCC